MLNIIFLFFIKILHLSVFSAFVCLGTSIFAIAYFDDFSISSLEKNASGNYTATFRVKRAANYKRQIRLYYHFSSTIPVSTIDISLAENSVFTQVSTASIEENVKYWARLYETSSTQSLIYEDTSLNTDAVFFFIAHSTPTSYSYGDISIPLKKYYNFRFPEYTGATHSDAEGLFQTNRTTIEGQGIVYPADKAVTSSAGKIASTYDQALIVIDSVRSGDYQTAEEILDFYAESAKNNDFYQLFYYNHARESYEESSGDVLWLGMAILHYVAVSGNHKYSNLLKKIRTFIEGKIESNHTNYRGKKMIYVKLGEGYSGSTNDAVSSEHNLDLFAFLKMYQKVYLNENEKILSLPAGSQFERYHNSSSIKEYNNMLIEESGIACYYFAYKNNYVGFTATITELRVFNQVFATDVKSWGVLALLPYGVISSTEAQEMVQSCEDESQLPSGFFDFTNEQGRVGRINNQPMVSYEWSAQMLLAYKHVNSSSTTIDTLRTALQTELNASSGIPYASISQPPIPLNNVLNFGLSGENFNIVLTSPSIAPLIWYVFAEANFNPFVIDHVASEISTSSAALGFNRATYTTIMSSSTVSSLSASNISSITFSTLPGSFNDIEVPPYQYGLRTQLRALKDDVVPISLDDFQNTYSLYVHAEDSSTNQTILREDFIYSSDGVEKTVRNVPIYGSTFQNRRLRSNILLLVSTSLATPQLIYDFNTGLQVTTSIFNFDRLDTTLVGGYDDRGNIMCEHYNIYSLEKVFLVPHKRNVQGEINPYSCVLPTIFDSSFDHHSNALVPIIHKDYGYLKDPNAEDLLDRYQYLQQGGVIYLVFYFDTKYLLGGVNLSEVDIIITQVAE